MDTTPDPHDERATARAGHSRPRLWRERDRRSLPDIHGTVPVPRSTLWRRLFTFSGPAFMVSVGYMDPGNWATDLQGGARFGYQLIWVILISNLMAILLQTLAARLGIVTGRDLAQACREHYPLPVVYVLWILCEIAIAACDLAEVLGSAIGLHLLFGIPLLWGVVLTAFDVLLLLMLQAYGIRKMEALILVLVSTIGVCFALEMVLSRPDATQVVSGLVPQRLSGGALFIAIGIIGATVMPHNLYLHSALVQSRAVEATKAGVAQATRFNLIDSVVALNAAFFVNAAILVLAAAAFFKTGHHQVATLEEAHALLEPLLGSHVAPLAFAIALLAAGQSSTITGTLAGQIVMEGFIRLRLRPVIRRLLTRSLAIVPAVLVILWQGEAGVDPLLVLSQVILSLQLSFAIVPLVHFTSDRRRMAEFATPAWGQVLAWLTASLIICLNLKLVYETIVSGYAPFTLAGLHLSRPVIDGHPVVRYLLLPAILLLVPLLLWMVVEPLRRGWRHAGGIEVPVPVLPSAETPLGRQYRRIAIALEASPHDPQILASVIPLIRAAGSEVVLIHALESATARFIGSSVRDTHALAAAGYLEGVARQLTQSGVRCGFRVGAGEPEDEIARIAEEEHADLIVTGSHGHRWLGDLFHGSTTSELRHRTSIPVLTVRAALPP